MHSGFLDLTRLVRQLPQNRWLHGWTATGINIISRHIAQVICSFILFLKSSESAFCFFTSYCFLSRLSFETLSLDTAESLFSVLVSLISSGTMGTDVSLNSYPTGSLILDGCSSQTLSPSLSGSFAPLLILASLMYVPLLLRSYTNTLPPSRWIQQWEADSLLLAIFTTLVYFLPIDVLSVVSSTVLEPLPIAMSVPHDEDFLSVLSI
jgi:hypothetical protein